MKKIFTTFVTFAAILLFSSSLFAQSGVGKLIGRVVDKESREPLIGANVIIVGTELGAATDVNGNFFVLNIVPGTYDVRFSYVGYGPKTFKEVRIVAGITYELNAELSSDFQLEEIVITGKKLFEEKATNTTKVIDANEIAKIPVKGVANIASLQAGVVKNEGSGGADGNATINVRGGRGGEVLYIVDGVAQNDAYTGSNYSQVSNSAIDQIAFQIGGYEAKYGQAQSGIISVTTKSGNPTYAVFGDVLTSSFTDPYGYNLYTLNLSGPIIPDEKDHTIFLSGERGWFLDANPKAISLQIPTKGIDSKTLPYNSSGVWRYTARTYHNLSPFSVRLGANINLRDYRGYTHSYAKNNPEHNLRYETGNYSFSGRLSHNLSQSSFWNLNLGYRQYNYEAGDGIWFDNIEAYGDTSANRPYVEPGTALIQGSRVTLDPIGLFYKKGRVQNVYQHMQNSTLSADADFTSQIENHLVDIGGGFQYNTLRYFSVAPVGIAIDNNKYSLAYRLALQTPFFFGFDITGKNTAANDEKKRFNNENPADTSEYSVAAAPRHPLVAYFYVQDRFELSDLVINFGLRFDYFDSKADVLRDDKFPYAYGNPELFDDADFVKKDPEFYVSPRIGLGFPVTSTTVFHAQFGKFIQPPSLQDVFTSVNSLSNLIRDQNFGINTGNVNSEVTTQYEIGFRQILGNNLAALNITAFYKNTKGLINDETTYFYRSIGSPQFRYYGPRNSDFGTVKGLAVSLDVTKISYFSLAFDYTYSLAEGTGSSTSSSTTAAFRNDNGETPKVIAPLDFDQRHTGIINVDFSVPKDEMGIFENLSLNLLFSFQSGRPYTPLQMQNITPGGGSNLGETKGYVNSAYGPGSNRLDLKLEKTFLIEKTLSITPYLWIENVFDVDNAVSVYRTTGNPYSTGYLSTEEGKALAKGRGPDYVSDYMALERDPSNFGIPRLIKLGLKVNFTGFNF